MAVMAHRVSYPGPLDSSTCKVAELYYLYFYCLLSLTLDFWVTLLLLVILLLWIFKFAIKCIVFIVIGSMKSCQEVILKLTKNNKLEDSRKYYNSCLSFNPVPSSLSTASVVTALLFSQRYFFAYYKVSWHLPLTNETPFQNTYFLPLLNRGSEQASYRTGSLYFNIAQGLFEFGFHF